MNQPHVVFILSDQHNPLVVGGAGDPHVRTPHLDRLMDQGVWHRNCYCPSPLCVASRMAMLAGLLPSRTGVFTNFQTLRSDRATFVHSLAAAGYRTVLCGRMHFVGPDQRHGYAERLVGELTPVFWGTPGPDYGPLHGTPGQHRVAVQRSGPGCSNVICYDRDVVDGACTYLERYSARQPLFLTVGLYGPHCPYVCPPDLFEHYYRHLPPPSVPDRFLETAHPAVTKWLKNRAMLDAPQHEVRRARAAYYGLTELLDQHLGRLLAVIDATLGLDQTLVIYASDHGDTIGHNGLFWKSNFYEGSARVPLVWRAPGQFEPRRSLISPTSLLDLGSTLIELVGGLPLPEHDGRSLLAVLRGKEPEDQDRAVISQLADAKGDQPSAMIRRGNWKLVEYHGYDAPQLFDLATDPAEQCDRGSDPAYQQVRRQLSDLLRRHWDAASVAADMPAWRRHAELLHKSLPCDHPVMLEQWRGRVEDNYIIAAPADP